MAKSEGRNEPRVGQVISPGASPAEPIDVVAEVKKRTHTAISPTDRLEKRADLHITELKSDKSSLHAELHLVRYTEIPHLREDIRWLEARESSLQNSLTLLHTSYEWAISFNWFSFALIAIGGCVVSYAAFFPPDRPTTGFDTQKLVATFALASLLIGVFVQAFVSYRGKQALKELPKGPAESQRPSPNPIRPR